MPDCPEKTLNPLAGPTYLSSDQDFSSLPYGAKISYLTSIGLDIVSLEGTFFGMETFKIPSS